MGEQNEDEKKNSIVKELIESYTDQATSKEFKIGVKRQLGFLLRTK